jgi:uncharacterized delta-60 repeat protein
MRVTLSTVAILVICAPSVRADGTLDPSFGTGGIVTTPLNGGGLARQAVTQPDGKLVVVGTGFNLATPTSANDIVLARYLSNGSLDPTFGSGGLVVTHIPGPSGIDFADDVALQPDGRIVVAGHKTEAQFEMVAVRYLGDGSLDPSFGTNGIARPSLAGNNGALALAIQPDGAILLGGWTRPSSAPQRMSVVRLLANGTLDVAFGTGGVASVDASGNGTGATVFDMALQPDGRMVLTGFAIPNGGADAEVATVRFTTTGLPDGTFGTGGVVRTNVGVLDEVGMGVAVQADGRIVVGGYTNGVNQEALVVRYTAGGTLDPSFGTGGMTMLNLGVQNQARALIVQPDGKITTAGFHGTTFSDFMLARFTSAGVLDPTFGSTGIVITSTSAGRDEGNGIHIPSPDRLLVAGQNDGSTGFALARYSATTPVGLKSFSAE